MTEIDNDTFVQYMKQAWQDADDCGRNEFFTVLEQLLGTNLAIEIRDVLQVSL
jgi:hypothetical protein